VIRTDVSGVLKMGTFPSGMLPGERPRASTEDLAVWLRWWWGRQPGSHIGALRGSAGAFALAGSGLSRRGGVTGTRAGCPAGVLALCRSPVWSCWLGEHWERGDQMAADGGGPGSRAHLSPVKASTWKSLSTCHS